MVMRLSLCSEAAGRRYTKIGNVRTDRNLFERQRIIESFTYFVHWC